MSEENVELVRRILEAWNRGDLDAAAAELDTDVVWTWPKNVPEAGTHTGRDEVMRRLEEFLEAWNGLTITIERLVDADDRVVALVRYSGMGQESGIEVSSRSTDAQVWTVRDGSVVSVELYGGSSDASARALRAAGVET
jgi:uncharacterized protein